MSYVRAVQKRNLKNAAENKERKMGDFAKAVDKLMKAKQKSGLSDEAFKKCISYVVDFKKLSKRDKDNEIDVYKKNINDVIESEIKDEDE